MEMGSRSPSTTQASAMMEVMTTKETGRGIRLQPRNAEAQVPGHAAGQKRGS